jgi:hypothetical protein
MADNFWKMFREEFADKLELIGKNKKINVILHVLRNIGIQDNLYIGTIPETANKLGISEKTVQNIFREMCDKDVMRMQSPGVYMFNPALVMFGPAIHKHKLVMKYQMLSKTKPNQTRKES